MLHEEGSTHYELLSYLRYELCAPINSMVAYSSLMLEDRDTQRESSWFQDIQQIRDCSHQLLTIAIAIIDSRQLESSASDAGFIRLKITLRMRLIGLLSTIVGYCKILLEEAPADLTSGIENINGSAQQLLSKINDIDNLARQQMQAIDARTKKTDERSRVQSSLDSMSKALTERGYKNQASVTISKSQRFEKLQKQIEDSHLDVETLYRPSLYPSLTSFSNQEELSAPLQTSPVLEDERSPTEKALLESDASISDVLDVPQSCKMIAVQSFRGGTGKSSIVSHLAISLARRGKRVGIIDINLQSPGIQMLSGLDDVSIHRTINDYLWCDCPLSQCAYNLSHHLPEAAVDSGGAIHLIPASTRLDDITRTLQADYDKRKLFDSFQIFANDLKLDCLLIDTHPGVTEETLQAISACSLLILVLCPDYQDYQGTSVILDLANCLSVRETMLIVNKAPQSFDVKEYRERLEAAYEVPVADVLPFSEDMMSLTSSEIFSAHHFNHPIAEAMGKISERITNN